RKWRLSERPNGVQALAFSPDGKTMVTAGGSVIDVLSGKRKRRLDSRSGESRLAAFTHHMSVAFAHHSPLAAMTASDSTGQIWNVQTGILRHTLKGSHSEMTSVAFSPDDRLTASAHADGTVQIWETGSGRL